MGQKRTGTDPPICQHTHEDEKHSNRFMTTSLYGNIFRVTGPLLGESTLKKASAEQTANNRDAGDLRRHCAHHNVTVMLQTNEVFARLLVTLNIIMNHENIFEFSIIAQFGVDIGTGIWNLSSWRSRTPIFYRVNTIGREPAEHMQPWTMLAQRSQKYSCFSTCDDAAVTFYSYSKTQRWKKCFSWNYYHGLRWWVDFTDGMVYSDNQHA